MNYPIPAPVCPHCGFSAPKGYEHKAAECVAAAEIERLRAELAEAKRDAERYRKVRRGQKWSVINGIGDVLRGEALDAAVDAAKDKP